MLVGIPGSGKTTYLNETFVDHYIASSDDIIEATARECGLTYEDVFKDSIGFATKIAEAQIEFASVCQKNVIVDRTNLTKKSRARMMSFLHRAKDYNKIALYFDTPLEIIKKRLTKRNEDGKIISPQLLTEMQARLEPPTEDEGFNEVRIIRV